MPGSVTVIEAAGQPQAPGSADFTMIFVGPATDNPVTAGQITPAYSDPPTAVTDLGVGDVVDGLCQAISKTPGNPAPPPAYAYITPSTNPGTYAAAAVISGVTGTAVPVNNAAVVPKGTYAPWMRVVTDGTIGTTGITADASLDGGRTTKRVALGTGTVYNFPSADGWPGTGAQAGFIFEPAAATKTALYTKLTLLQTTMSGTGHFVLTTSSVHLAADTTNDTALAAVPAATTDATAVTLFAACKAFLSAHGQNLTAHTIADATLATALSAIPTVTDIAGVDLYLDDLIAAYNAHRQNITGTVHGSADATNTITAYTPIPGTLIAGDTWYTATLPPSWASADLYTAGPPAVGAFAAIAESSVQAAVIVITEPVAVGDFSTIVAGLNYCATFGKRLLVLCRFRDPTSGETDAAYITAFQTFKASFLDSRIACCAGSCWLTDAFSASVYLRSFLPALAARWQSFAVIAGQQGEQLSQNAGWVARGPLEGASLKDTNGNTIGHDEATRGGITATPGAATGGGIALYYQRIGARQGTYVDNRSGVLYPVGSAVLLYEDRRIANAVEQLLTAIALDTIGGADATSPINSPPVTLDPDLVDALGAKMSSAIAQNYPNEFQNATAPGLVVVNPAVTVVGGMVALAVTINERFWNYGDTVVLTFALTR